MTDTSALGLDVLQPGDRRLYRWHITPDTDLTLRNGSVGFVLVHMAIGFDRLVEDIDDNYRNGELDDWGYAMRAVRGYSQISRHALGAAEDLNATDNPLGVDHTFTAEQEKIIRRRLRKYQGVIRWGGDYSGRVDPMHFEIDKHLREVERVARGLVDTPVGQYILKNNPGQLRVINS